MLLLSLEFIFGYIRRCFYWITLYVRSVQKREGGQLVPGLLPCLHMTLLKTETKKLQKFGFQTALTSDSQFWDQNRFRQNKDRHARIFSYFEGFA